MWQERPVAFVALHEPVSMDDPGASLRAHALSRLAKWQVPDAFIVVPDLPKGNTGKIDKIALRTALADAVAAD